MSARALGRAHGVGRDTVRRHWSRHVQIGTQASVFRGAPASQASDLISRILDVADHARELRDDADAADATAASLRADAVILAALERLRSGLGVDSAEVAVALREGDALAAAIERSVREMPEVGEVIAEALEQNGELALARLIQDFAEKQAAALTASTDQA